MWRHQKSKEVKDNLEQNPTPISFLSKDTHNQVAITEIWWGDWRWPLVKMSWRVVTFLWSHYLQQRNNSILFFMSLARYLYCVTPQNTTFELSCTLTCLSLMSSLWSGYPLYSILLLHDSCRSGMSSLFFSKWLIPQQSLLSPLLYNYVFGHTGETAYEKSIKEWLRRFRRYFISPPLPKRKPMTRHDLW